MMEENNRVVIGQALSKLGEREEEILRRYYFDGQTMRQIARETGRSAEPGQRAAQEWTERPAGPHSTFGNLLRKMPNSSCISLGTMV